MRFFCSPLLLACFCCAMTTPPAAADPRFAELAQSFLEDVLVLSPTAATQVGFHRYHDPKTGCEIQLDELLEDMSTAGLEKQRATLKRYRQRFQKEVQREALNAEDQADYDLIQDQIALSLLELETIQNYRHNPTVYVELAGTALFLPMVLEYAPKQERFRHIIARLGRIPELLRQGRQNLVDTDPIYTKVALEENEGNVGLVTQALASQVPPDLKASYDAAAAPALKAFEEFSHFLKEELAQRSTGTWRLGKEKYRAKLRLALQTDLSPEQVLADAEAELARLRAEMLRVALTLHKQVHPGHLDHADLKGKERENAVIREVLDRIAEEHVEADRLKPDILRQLDELHDFVRRKDLVTLSSRDNLQVIDTPEFMRGIYAVAGFQPAPPLQPELGAFYWVTPIPSDWPRERAESKLREYNNYMLRLISIHEAIPGHYIQFEHANQIQPKTRRLVRAVFGNTPYVEGWAVYITRVLVEEGYLAAPGEKANPKLLLTLMKGELRAIANAILDVRMHTRNMSDQEAMDLMIRDTFQERTEAEQKLRRAKLSSAQLPTYFVGLREWLRLRDEARAAEGDAFSLKRFHDRALAEGALPMPTLRRLLMSHD